MSETVVTFGETMALVRGSDIGSFPHIASLALGIGGAESNVAVGLRRLGVTVSWLGRVGDDSLGIRVTREIRAEGVDVRAVVDDGAATGLMLKERPSVSSTVVHYYRAGSAGSRLEPADLPAGWIEEAALLHITGITPLLSNTARDATFAAVDRAVAAGVPVSFDVNHRTKLATAEAARPILRALAERSTIVFGGEEELALLHPDVGVAESATRLQRAGCAQVVVKRGEYGAAAYLSDRVVDAPGVRITPLDTVGAGDAFVAGYLNGHLDGLPVEESLQRANACGALACLVPGDWESAPTRRELERFLRGAADPVTR